MKHLGRRALRLLITLPALLALSGADGQTTPSITALMHKQYTVSRAPFKVIGKEIDSQAPDWDKVREAGERFTVLSEALAKKSPRRGDPESWRRLVERNTADARAIEESAKARDLAMLKTTREHIAASCKACHDVHRFRPGN
jgi:cytochrome c556